MNLPDLVSWLNSACWIVVILNRYRLGRRIRALEKARDAHFRDRRALMQKVYPVWIDPQAEEEDAT
jgi:hypothetical protein